MSAESRLETFIAMLGCHHNMDEVAMEVHSINRSLDLEECFSRPTSIVTVPKLLSTEKVDATSPSNPIQNMNMRVYIERSSIASLPRILLRNATLSFGEFVDSRLTQFASLLSTRAKPETNTQVAKLLQGAAPISFTCAESTFRTLPLMNHQSSRQIVIIPFILTVMISTEILGVKTVQVRLTAPGTIVGTFSPVDKKMTQADIQIDVDRLYRSMKMRCDQVVKKAYDTATAQAQDVPPKERIVPGMEDIAKKLWWLREEEHTFTPLQN